MTKLVRTYRTENPLALAVERAGGMKLHEALERAEAGVEAVREECMSVLDAKIAEIDAATSGASFSSSEADIRKVYLLANEILNEAGTFGLHELSEAGRSLCVLTASWGESDLDGRAISVHVAAMKSLRRPDVAGDPRIRAAVLDGLRQVTEKVARV